MVQLHNPYPIKTVKMEAKELVAKFIPFTRQWTGEIWSDDLNCAKQCALIAVDEILKDLLYIEKYSPVSMEARTIFWQSVKEEINRL